MDVIELVKSIRFFKKGFKQLLSADELKKLEESNEYTIIHSDDEDEEKHKVSGASDKNVQIVTHSKTSVNDITLDKLNVSLTN